MNIDYVMWDKSLKQNNTIVIEKRNIIVGFGDIDENGYLDRLYVHKDNQNHGVVSAILKELKIIALKKEIELFQHIILLRQNLFQKA